MDDHIKNRLPDIASLEKNLKIELESNLADFISVTNSSRMEVISNRRFTGLAFLFAISVFVALYFIQGNFTPLLENFLIGSAMIWLVVVLITGRRWMINDKLLAKEINMAMTPFLTSVFNRVLMYTNDSTYGEVTKQLLSESELITIDNITVSSDDIYTVYGEQEISFRELLVTKKVHGPKGQTNIIEIFKGLFVVVQLNRNHEAKTYVSTEGDRSGFAHRTFWSDLFENSSINETVLEWNDFEKDLHVASSDGRKAREILNPEFMLDLHSWWLEHKLNVRISFINNKMFLLLPEASIKLGTSTTSTKLDSIEKYALSLARPIWRSLVLVDDVSR